MARACGRVNNNCLGSYLLKVSPQEMVQEIHQVLMDREDTCHRTCFSLQLDGNVLDNFAELKTIEGLQEGSLLKVVEGKFLQAWEEMSEGFLREGFWPPVRSSLWFHFEICVLEE